MSDRAQSEVTLKKFSINHQLTVNNLIEYPYYDWLD